MSDLTDERLAVLVMLWSHGNMPDTYCALVELQRRRAEQAAGREHVERVVKDAVMATERTATTAVPIHKIDAIVARAADRLSVPVLSEDEVDALAAFRQDAIYDPLDHQRAMDVIDRLIATRKP